MSFLDAIDICSCGYKMKKEDKFCSVCGKSKIQLNSLKNEEREQISKTNEKVSESENFSPGYMVYFNRNTGISFSAARYTINKTKEEKNNG